MSAIGDAVYGISTKPFHKLKCPLCTAMCNYNKSLHSNTGTEIGYKCEKCKITFSLCFPENNLQYKQTKIVLHCPSCKKLHNTEVVGEINTRFVPCEDCWEYEEDILLMAYGGFGF